ncbi:hypothetical protein ACF05W_33095 [Streptomyces lydicus]|uniref:hypothetical protein n=1 Tax=Streptomyces lydicus TaxID=47763 RepID=UPI0036FABBFC
MVQRKAAQGGQQGRGEPAGAGGRQDSAEREDGGCAPPSASPATMTASSAGRRQRRTKSPAAEERSGHEGESQAEECPTVVPVSGGPQEEPTAASPLRAVQRFGIACGP